MNFHVCFNLFMLLFAVTPCLVVVDHGVNPNLKKDLAKKMNHDLEKLSVVENQETVPQRW